jgi:hypothetical protein
MCRVKTGKGRPVLFILEDLTRTRTQVPRKPFRGYTDVSYPVAYTSPLNSEQF